MNYTGRMSATALRSTILRAGAVAPRRHLHQTPAFLALKNESSSVPDALDDGAPVKGRTGGGEELDSSRNAPPKPKISNLSVPGANKAEGLSEEQQKEVDQHNKEFDEKHDRGNAAADDKVDKKFWTGGS